MVRPRIRVGDRVLVVANVGNYFTVGKRGTVTDDGDLGPRDFRVLLDNGESIAYYLHEIEPLSKLDLFAEGALREL